MLAHVGALSTKSNVEAGRSIRSAGSVQPNRGASTLGSLGWSPPSQELSRRQMRALLVLVSVPRRPSWHEIYVVMPDFRGANRERCVSYATHFAGCPKNASRVGRLSTANTEESHGTSVRAQRIACWLVETRLRG